MKSLKIRLRNWRFGWGRAMEGRVGFPRTLKVLENCSRCWKVLEFQCKVELQRKMEQTQKDLRDKITHVVEELKKT